MTDMSTFVGFEGVHGICVCAEHAVCAVDVAVSLAELVDVGHSVFADAVDYPYVHMADNLAVFVSFCVPWEVYIVDDFPGFVLLCHFGFVLFGLLGVLQHQVVHFLKAFVTHAVVD